MQNIQDLKQLGEKKRKTKRKTQKEDTFIEISSLIFWLLEDTSEVSIFYEYLWEVTARNIEHRAGKIHSPLSTMTAITLLESSPGSIQQDNENLHISASSTKAFFFKKNLFSNSAPSICIIQEKNVTIPE